MTTAIPRETERRRRNRAEYWNRRQASAETNKDLALVMVDFARAVATDVSGKDPSHPVWHELSQVLHGWASRYNA